MLLSKDMDNCDHSTYVPSAIYGLHVLEITSVLKAVIFHPLCARNNEDLLENFSRYNSLDLLIL